MLYETSARKSGNPPGKAAPRIAKPQTVIATPKVPAARLKSPVVKGWPSQQKRSTKPPVANAANYSQARPSVHKKSPGAKPSHATVKGWPSHRKTVAKYRGITAGRFPHHQAGAPPRLHHHRHVRSVSPSAISGWPPRKQGTSVQKHHTAARYGNAPITGWQQQRKIGYRYPQRWSYYPGTTKRYYYNDNSTTPVYVNDVAVQQPAANTGWTTNRAAPTSPACPQPQTDSVTPNFRNTNLPSGGRPVCHNCGSGSKGCTTLSRFAFNSSELNQNHIRQIGELANRILSNNLNAVIATGHTDSSGTEDYNEALGSRRASAVMFQLKKQLKILRPGSHRNVFWKTDSKGESLPITQNDAAANRRVEICLRRINLVA